MITFEAAGGVAPNFRITFVRDIPRTRSAGTYGVRARLTDNVL